MAKVKVKDFNGNYKEIEVKDDAEALTLAIQELTKAINILRSKHGR